MLIVVTIAPESGYEPRVAKHVLGSLADRIRVPKEQVIAIEAALGHNLQLVLTEQPEAAQEIFADLVANKKGRANIGCLGLKNPTFAPADTAVEAPGESALKVIEADEKGRLRLSMKAAAAEAQEAPQAVQ